ncbi:AMP-binding protein [Rhodococcus hoagii]|nr:AMP-binding protein [Prescottella equi]
MVREPGDGQRVRTDRDHDSRGRERPHRRRDAGRDDVGSGGPAGGRFVDRRPRSAATRLPAGRRRRGLRAGPSLARGYARDAGSTAGRFVASPFGGGRMYRTGDLARWRANGTLDIVGRVDHQIQLRGIRVEPGEVDALLVTHRGVRAATTVAIDERLVTFACGDGLRPDRLREWLAERLPAHAVPSRVVLLDSLPLTASGKVDRAVLVDRAPTPDGAHGRSVHGVVEELVADEMQRILGIEVNASTDFFDHGGNSLSAPVSPRGSPRSPDAACPFVTSSPVGPPRVWLPSSRARPSARHSLRPMTALHRSPRRSDDCGCSTSSILRALPTTCRSSSSSWASCRRRRCGTVWVTSSGGTHRCERC